VSHIEILLKSLLSEEGRKALLLLRLRYELDRIGLEKFLRNKETAETAQGRQMEPDGSGRFAGIQHIHFI
jgi:hypothetical protein